MSTGYSDPFEIWKTFYHEVEPQISKSLHNVLGSEAYTAFSTQLLNAFLQMEQQFNKNIENLLQTYKLPTMKDFARLSELVVGLEEKVDRLEERFIAMERQEKQVAPDVAKRLEEISAQLATLHEGIQGLAKTQSAETESKQRRTQKSSNN